jgi:hypothetical protein
MMTGGQGIFRGFLLGVLLAFLVAGGAAWYVYGQIQRQIAPENTRQVVETQLARLVSSPVSVGDARIKFPNLLTLERVKISSASETLADVEKVEASAEGGIDGLRRGRFLEVVLTHPVISLHLRNGKWNLVEFLEPILAKMSSAQGAPISATPGVVAPAVLPLQVISLKGLELKVQTGEKLPEVTLRAASVELSRKDPGSPWTLLCEGSHLRLDTLTGEWPLQNLFEALQGLAPDRKPADSAKNQGAAKSDAPLLAGIRLENASVEIHQPAQILTIEGFSLNTDELFQVIRVQTGSLEKKNLKPLA